MLPKRYRLTRSRDFVRVRRAGRSAGTQHVTLYVLRTRTPELRIGFSVSKRVGNATVRNRVKRRLREVVRAYLPALNKGQDLVLIARPTSANASYHQLADTVGTVLRKSGALQDMAETKRNA